MTKNTKTLNILLFLTLVVLSIIQSLFGIIDNLGIKSVGGNVSLHVFFAQQLGGGSNNLIVTILMSTIIVLSGSLFYEYIKNNNTFFNMINRCGYKRFIFKATFSTFSLACLYRLFSILIALVIINVSFSPIIFQNTKNYFFDIPSSDLVQLMLYAILSIIGYGIFAVLVFSIGLFINKNSLYIGSTFFLFLFLLVFPLLVNLNINWIKVTTFTLFLPTLISPYQITLLGQKSPLDPNLAFIICGITYIIASLILCNVWVRKSSIKK